MMIKLIAFILLAAFLMTSTFADDSDYCHKNCNANFKECHAKANKTANSQTFSWDGTVYGMEKGKEDLKNYKQSIKTELYQKCETEKYNCQHQCSSDTTPHCCSPTQEIKLP
jgi:hypothetical protein